MRYLKLGVILTLALILAACDNIPFLNRSGPELPPEHMIAAALAVHSRENRMLTSAAFTTDGDSLSNYVNFLGRCNTFRFPDDEPFEVDGILDFGVRITAWLNTNRHTIPYEPATIKDVHWYWDWDDIANIYLPTSRVTYISNTHALHVTIPNTGACTATLTTAHSVDDQITYLAWRKEGNYWIATSDDDDNIATYTLPASGPYGMDFGKTIDYQPPE